MEMAGKLAPGSQSGRAHARACVRYQVARFGGPPPGLPRTRLGAHGAASLRCPFAGRGAVADADLMKAGWYRADDRRFRAAEARVWADGPASRMQRA